MLSRSYNTVTPTLGSASEAIYAHQKVLLRLAVKPTTSSTQYDFEVIDQYGLSFYSIQNQTGELEEVMEIPSITNLSLNITNSSADEDFEVLFIFRDER
jgi:hypothetical protein